MDDTEIIYVMLLGRKAMCPTCAGMLQMVGEEKLRCIDCNDWFKIIELGRVEGEVRVRRIGG